jgi:fructokinase
VGSTTLVNDNGAAQTAALIADAKPTSTICFDPNCRPNLVSDKAAYLESMQAFAESADIVRMSDVDFQYLHGDEAYGARAEALFARGVTLLVVTRGTDGAEAWHRKAGFVKAEAPRVDVVDTIGAGDSFQAALLAALHRQDRLARPTLGELTADELGRALSFACRCAAITCTRRGADPPRSNEAAWPI